VRTQPKAEEIASAKVSVRVGVTREVGSGTAAPEKINAGQYKGNYGNLEDSQRGKRIESHAPAGQLTWK